MSGIYSQPKKTRTRKAAKPALAVPLSVIEGRFRDLLHTHIEAGWIPITIVFGKDSKSTFGQQPLLAWMLAGFNLDLLPLREAFRDFLRAQVAKFDTEEKSVANTNPETADDDIPF